MAQILVNGISVGSIYALLAVSLWIIFAPTRTFHLSHAIVYTTSGYALYLLHVKMDLHFLISMLGAMVWAGLLGALIEYAVYSPMRRRGATGLTLFVGSAAILTMGTALIGLFFGEEPKGLNANARVVMQSPVVVLDRDLYAVGLVLLVGIGFPLVLKKTRWGQILRASMDNPRLAKCLNINVDQIYLACFVVGSAILVLPLTLKVTAGGVGPEIGLGPTLTCFVAVIVGGLGSVNGAIIAGLLLGIFENVMLLWMSASWLDVIVFAILFIVLIFFPQGLRAGPKIRAHSLVGV